MTEHINSAEGMGLDELIGEETKAEGLIDHVGKAKGDDNKSSGEGSDGEEGNSEDGEIEDSAQGSLTQPALAVFVGIP